MTDILNNLGVLIVEDDEDLCNSLCEFFAEEGAIVFSAKNGEEAIQISLIEKIDLIVSDIRMPIMDGIELLESIHGLDHNAHNAPLVWLMSGQSDLKEENALALGAQGLISKPFKFDIILEKIKQSLNER